MKMRSILILATVLLLSAAVQAQHVRVRLNFPAGVNRYAPGPAPYGGAIWIGPEWEWRGGSYVHVPGYWAKPRGRSHWVAGHWRWSRHGYIWVPGRWR